MSMKLRFDRSNGEIDTLIDDLLQRVQVHHPEMIRQMILGALKSGQENDYLADQKLMRTTMKEMRFTNKVFAPYRNRRKVSIFGSARTAPSEPIYQKCVQLPDCWLSATIWLSPAAVRGSCRPETKAPGRIIPLPLIFSCRSNRAPIRS